jgi:predicted AlkP superfamily phosphohydrolase/phosphomutase
VAPPERLHQAEQILSELTQKLEAIVDPETGERPIYKVYRASEVYSGPCKDLGPDLIIGYNDGYRASWETALGKIPEDLFGDNLKKWSGDHCMARELIPGILFTSKPIEVGEPALVDLAPTILAEFGIEKTPEMIGRNLFSSRPTVAQR